MDIICILDLFYIGTDCRVKLSDGAACFLALKSKVFLVILLCIKCNKC